MAPVGRHVPDADERRFLLPTDAPLLGIIAEKGEPETLKIQAKASLKRGEMTAADLPELLVFIAPYAGYPRAAALVMPIEEVISEALGDNTETSAGAN